MVRIEKRRLLLVAEGAVGQAFQPRTRLFREHGWFSWPEQRSKKPDRDHGQSLQGLAPRQQPLRPAPTPLFSAIAFVATVNFWL